VEPKRKDFAPEKNVEKVERGSEAEAEKKIKTGFFFFSFSWLTTKTGRRRWDQQSRHC
jgi:hypothetical protein